MKQKLSKQLSNQSEAQTSPWLGEYLDCFTFKMKPITQAFIDRFSTDLIKWAHNDNEALIISQFYLQKGISPQTYYRWVNQYSSLKDANETAKLCIGNRREIGALKRKFSEAMVTRRQHAYDPEWAESDKYHNQLKIDANIDPTKKRPTAIYLGPINGMDEYIKKRKEQEAAEATATKDHDDF